MTNVADKLIQDCQQAASRVGQDEAFAAVIEGRSIISNCIIGFMITQGSSPCGRAVILCPVDGYPIRGDAEYAYIKSAVKGWSRRLRDYEASRA